MKKIEFESLKIQRASDIIEIRISNMITKGTITSGDKLPTEKELSDQFNVSMVTVRQALRGLEVSGLIEKKRGKGGGIYVTELNNDSIKIALNNFLRRREFSAHQLAQVRLTIEPTIARLAVSEITPDEVLALEEVISICEDRLEKAQGSIQPKDLQVIGEKNLEFHRLIAQATHNPVFALTIDYLIDFMFYFKKISTPVDVAIKIVQDHRGIFTSLKARHADEAQTKMLHHVESVEAFQLNEGLYSRAKGNELQTAGKAA